MHIHHIIVNLPDRTTELTCGFEARQQVLVYGSDDKAFQQTLHEVKALYPNFTSLVVTILPK